MLLRKLIRIKARFIYQTLLPPTCVLCGYFTGQSFNICLNCQQDLPSLPHLCPQCGQFLTSGEFTCGLCLSNPPPFERTFALFPYEPPIIHLVTKLKFHQQLSYAQAFGELLTEKIRTHWYLGKTLPDTIIPIPLHPKRLRERGFNQALEIARPVARELCIPIDARGVRRTKNTAAQSGLPAEERKHNIANAFAIGHDYTGKFIAVIDDVITTGHTMREFCLGLKEKGAARIDVWCCARRG